MGGRGLTSKNLLLSYSSGGQKSEVKVSARLVLSEIFLLGL